MKWEPIETAPVSQSVDVLVWADGYLKPLMAWNGGLRGWIMTGTMNRLANPTHWMHLPTPPKETPDDQA